MALCAASNIAPTWAPEFGEKQADLSISSATGLSGRIPSSMARTIPWGGVELLSRRQSATGLRSVSRQAQYTCATLFPNITGFASAEFARAHSVAASSAKSCMSHLVGLRGWFVFLSGLAAFFMQREQRNTQRITGLGGIPFAQSGNSGLTAFAFKGYLRLGQASGLQVRKNNFPVHNGHYMGFPLFFKLFYATDLP
jgi:hypothetical protein